MKCSADELEQEAAKLEARIADQQDRLRQLAAAKDEEDHQARRYGDSLERRGGRGPELESKLSMLGQGRALTARALREAAEQLEELRGRLADVRGEIARRGAG